MPMRNGETRLRERLGNRRSCATLNRIFFDRDDRAMTTRDLSDECDIERFDEAHVDDRGIEPLRNRSYGVQQRAEY
jgi:hypothetical protein